MFNLNESNRFVIARHPCDMRMGVNGMCGQVRRLQLDPADGSVYVFVGRGRKIMKILHWERGGYVMYYKPAFFGWLRFILSILCSAYYFNEKSGIGLEKEPSKSIFEHCCLIMSRRCIAGFKQ